jgi:hypothetical protein
MRSIVRRAAVKSLVSGCGLVAIGSSSGIALAEPFALVPNTLVISRTTYDRSQGAVASLAVGTALAGSATATTPAIAGNDDVGATTLTGSVTHESFRVVAGPTYGTAYRGVAFVE